MVSNSKKRFIAGAVCPKCSAMDTIQMYRIDDVDYRECVQCGFNDEMRFKQSPKELSTRVNVTAQEKMEHIQTVNILDLDKGK